MVPLPVPESAAMSLSLVVWSCHPAGMLVRNPLPAKGAGVTVGVDAAVARELGVDSWGRR